MKLVKCLLFSIGVSLAQGSISAGLPRAEEGIVTTDKRPDIRIIPFQDYHPQYQERVESDGEKHSLEGILNYQPNVSDWETFRSVIIEKAGEIGYAEEQLRKLSVHDAVMVSGRITAYQIEYGGRILTDTQRMLLKKSPIEIYQETLSVILAGGEPRSAEAVRLDELPTDELFKEGKGICRHYAEVNAGVFEVMRKINPQLKNTVMVPYIPTREEHFLTVPHAWNKVSTIVKGKKGLEILITFVDPQWLDDPNMTPDTMEQLYNAVDENHFGDGLMYLGY
jgi:hypothetical protein